MSAASSVSAFVDPLAQEGPPATQPLKEERAARERATILAPTLEGRSGADAIDLVRSRGLIAAIETVEMAEDGRQGLVIEQDPPADTRMVREGIVTLTLARAPAELRDVENEDLPKSQPSLNEIAKASEGADDTAEWFATLGASSGEAGSGDEANVPRRRRKHRRESAPIAGMVFETSPDPLPSTCDGLEEHPDLSPRLAPVGAFASAVAVLLAWFPLLSVSSAWHRRLIFAGVIVVLLILARDGGSHLHHQVPSTLVQATTLSLPSTTIQALSHSQSRQTATHAQHLSKRPILRTRRSPRRVSRKRIAAIAASSVAERHPVIPSGNSPSVTQGSPSARVAPPFIYLGK